MQDQYGATARPSPQTAQSAEIFPGDSAGSLSQPSLQVPQNATLQQVMNLFVQLPGHHSLPVIDKGMVVGLIHRGRIMEILATEQQSKKRQRPCLPWVDKNALVFDAYLPIHQVARQLTDEDDFYVRQHFVVTHKGHYYGMGHTKDLLKHITEQKLTEARHANPLTLLPGNLPIEQQIYGHLQSDTAFYLAYLDLDHFKPFNDEFGYRMGDEVIQLVAHLLQQYFRQTNAFIGHIGGDDFVVISTFDPEPTLNSLLSTFGQRLQALLPPDKRGLTEMEIKNRHGQLSNVPTVCLSIGLFNSSQLETSSLANIAELAAQAKKAAKAQPGSVIVRLE